VDLKEPLRLNLEEGGGSGGGFEIGMRRGRMSGTAASPPLYGEKQGRSAFLKLR
jgi:hypothetical protein